MTDPALVNEHNAPRELRAQLDDVMYATLSEIPLGKPGKAVRSPDYTLHSTARAYLVTTECGR